MDYSTNDGQNWIAIGSYNNTSANNTQDIGLFKSSYVSGTLAETRFNDFCLKSYP